MKESSIEILQGLQIFSPLCTWIEPVETAQGLMLFFSKSGFTGKTIGVFYVCSFPHFEPCAEYIINVW